MGSTPDKLVERYLKHLEIELDELPRDRRHEIVDEIAGHIAEARAGLEHETEVDVRNILEGLGDPEDIAEEARERFEVRQPAPAAQFKPGWMEVAALIMLLIGGIVIPFFGWVIGVVLLWVSNAWNVRDKIIGTVVVPGGLGLSLFLLLYTASNSLGGGSLVCPVGPPSGPELNCSEQGSSLGFMNVFGVVLLIAIVVAPVITAAYLGYRLRRRPASAAA
jgi:uncharacterized membrane protein